MIQQNLLPFQFKIYECKTYWDTCIAITDMVVRGAGAIGAAAGFAMALAFLSINTKERLKMIREARSDIENTRPTARNLFYAVDRVYRAGLISVENAVEEAQAVASEDAAFSKAIGEYGSELIHEKANILTHCNAGWLAIVDSGSALAPIYEAQKRGINIHVWVDETRPRNQGASLTSWELLDAGIDHTIIPDNTGGHLMQQGLVDMVITGADRVAANGDAANKIGTYLKALAAKDNDVPFYIALPINTFDFACENGVRDIEIEQRNEDEVHMMRGLDSSDNVQTIRITPEHIKAANYGFDVTPARLITGLITEAGIIAANKEAIGKLK
ncbi:MAG: S-methyl-5-thioribose-1-phosphate isomerase [Ghiorsea sp.]|nr:S-methyl-5-thioribose-1-phosphate isomerase [Ghiorsea sp.]